MLVTATCPGDSRGVLALDDDLWRSLPHAYGNADDTPDLLRALAADPGAAEEKKIWHELWSALCHQGTVYGAAWAAVPHLIAIATERPPEERTEYLLFAAAIVRGSIGAQVTPRLAAPYHEAVSAARALAAATFERPDDEQDALVGLMAMAGLEAHAALADTLDAMLAGEDSFFCPECELELLVSLDEPPFVVTVFDDEDESSEVEPGAPRADVAWAVDRARAMDQPELAARIEALAGTATCPHCNAQFALLERNQP